MSSSNPLLNSISAIPALSSSSEYKYFNAVPDELPKFCGSGSIPLPCSKILLRVIWSIFSLASTGISIVKVESPPLAPSSESSLIVLYFLSCVKNSERLSPSYPLSTNIISCISSRSFIKPLYVLSYVSISPFIGVRSSR